MRGDRVGLRRGEPPPLAILQDEPDPQPVRRPAVVELA